jgi:hypothetical protein
VDDLSVIGQFVLETDGSRTIQSSILDDIDDEDDEEGQQVTWLFFLFFSLSFHQLFLSTFKVIQIDESQGETMHHLTSISPSITLLESKLAELTTEVCVAEFQLQK